MGLEKKFTNQQIRSRLGAFNERVNRATFMTLQYLGEDLSRYAKQAITFTPRTGNLQNSIGYVIVKDGEIVEEGSFDNSLSTSLSLAKLKSLALANKLAKSCNKSYTLIIVAGMNYAAYVEAKGFNVILPAELKAKIEVPQALKRLKSQIKKIKYKNHDYKP